MSILRFLWTRPEKRRGRNVRNLSGRWILPAALYGLSGIPGLPSSQGFCFLSAVHRLPDQAGNPVLHPGAVDAKVAVAKAGAGKDKNL